MRLHGTLALALSGLIPAPAQPPVKMAQIPEAPYVATSDEVAGAMLRLAGVTAHDVVYDLGCGDGRIVILAAQQFGARGVGIDIDPNRIQQARARADQAGVTRLVHFELDDLFNADIHEATVITLYLLPQMNLRLRSKLWQQLKPGTRVVSHNFDMGDWAPDKQEEVDGQKILVWTVPPR